MIPRWKQISSNLLVISSIALGSIAVAYGAFAGEWRATGFLGFAAVGFWLGAQELQTP